MENSTYVPKIILNPSAELLVSSSADNFKQYRGGISMEDSCEFRPMILRSFIIKRWSSRYFRIYERTCFLLSGLCEGHKPSFRKELIWELAPSHSVWNLFVTSTIFLSAHLNNTWLPTLPTRLSRCSNLLDGWSVLRSLTSLLLLCLHFSDLLSTLSEWPTPCLPSASPRW